MSGGSKPGVKRGPYRKKIGPRISTRIRELGLGETPPPGEPMRYRNANGYIRLRWRESRYELVECYEHRWVMGVVGRDDVQVHHINHVRDDNRPENLKVVTPSEHGEEHRTLDREEIVRLYESGLSTPQVGARIGASASAVYRALVASGVTPRSLSESQRAVVDHELVRRLHEAGVRSRRIAAALGVSPSLIEHRVKEIGLPPHPEGRPTEADIERARRALEAEGLAA